MIVSDLEMWDGPEKTEESLLSMSKDTQKVVISIVQVIVG